MSQRLGMRPSRSSVAWLSDFDISPAENGLEVEIVGEIAKMVELGPEKKQSGQPWMRR